MATPPKPAAASPQSFAALPVPFKVGIFFMLFAVVGAGYYFGLHSPLEDEIASAHSRHRQLDDEMSEARERQREYIRLREELSAREPIDRGNLRVLPEDAEMASFLQDLNGLAERSGLAIHLVEPRPEEPGEHYVRLPVTLQVRGRFHQLARFLYNVSELDRAISMENIHLHEPSAEGQDVVLNVELLATTYRRPAEEEAAAAAEAAAAEAAGG